MRKMRTQYKGTIVEHVFCVLEKYKYYKCTASTRDAIGYEILSVLNDYQRDGFIPFYMPIYFQVYFDYDKLNFVFGYELKKWLTSDDETYQ